MATTRSCGGQPSTSAMARSRMAVRKAFGADHRLYRKFGNVNGSKSHKKEPHALRKTKSPLVFWVISFWLFLSRNSTLSSFGNLPPGPRPVFPRSSGLCSLGSLPPPFAGANAPTAPEFALRPVSRRRSSSEKPLAVPAAPPSARARKPAAKPARRKSRRSTPDPQAAKSWTYVPPRAESGTTRSAERTAPFSAPERSSPERSARSLRLAKEGPWPASTGRYCRTAPKAIAPALRRQPRPNADRSCRGHPPARRPQHVPFRKPRPKAVKWPGRSKAARKSPSVHREASRR